MALQGFTPCERCGAYAQPERLDREAFRIAIANGFGARTYAQEEIRAELSAALTCARLGVGGDVKQHAAYITEWLRAFDGESADVLPLMADATAISDYLLGPSD